MLAFSAMAGGAVAQTCDHRPRAANDGYQLRSTDYCTLEHVALWCEADPSSSTMHDWKSDGVNWRACSATISQLQEHASDTLAFSGARPSITATTTATATSTLGPTPARTAMCFEEGTRYQPTFRSIRMVESAESCQDECSQDDRCAYFSFTTHVRPNKRWCYLAESSANASDNTKFISGPASCTQALTPAPNPATTPPPTRAPTPAPTAPTPNATPAPTPAPMPAPTHALAPAPTSAPTAPTPAPTPALTPAPTPAPTPAQTPAQTPTLAGPPCIEEATKYGPALKSIGEVADVDSYQVECAQNVGCARFSFKDHVRHDKRWCYLTGSSAVASSDPAFISGPKVCYDNMLGGESAPAPPPWIA